MVKTAFLFQTFCSFSAIAGHAQTTVYYTVEWYGYLWGNCCIFCDNNFCNRSK